MNKLLTLIAAFILGYSNSAFSLTTTYTDQTSFLGDVDSELFLIDFNAISNPLVGNGVFVGQVDFGSPEASNPDNVLFNSSAMTDTGSTTATNSVGPIDGAFLTADSVYAFSLDFLSSGNPQTISIFDFGGGLLDSVLTPAGGFFGLISDTSIGSFLITNGEFSPNNRDRFFIDNFGAYSVSPVPIPAAVWLFGTGILGLIGFSKRRKAA